LQSLIRDGALSVIYPDGTRRTYGDGTGHPVAMTIHDAALVGRLVRSPDMALGEGYMDQGYSLDNDDVAGFLALLLQNAARGQADWWRFPLARAQRLFRQVQELNPMGRSRENVAHHYDLDGALYDLFLDEDQQYSCAYFRSPKDTLEKAQAHKKAHIAAKLQIRPGMRVLDIGCGWGGMALTLARDFGAQVTGVTLSEEQHRVATARVAAAGLTDRIDIRLIDYRAVLGQFDRIVSVGMFEHVGRPNYGTYFARVHDLLAPDGVALIHTIGRSGEPGITSPWITKYIFPGGYCPALSEILPAIQKTGMYTTDIEVWRLHYAETLRHWRERFEARLTEAVALYDARFCRMWRYYLASSEMTFRHHQQVVFQIQLTHQQDAVPLTRDYLYPPATMPALRPLRPQIVQPGPVPQQEQV
jgi:cyclopropane-fatty-acyl-phospholipid synthase